jgi:hypothetical protein
MFFDVPDRVLFEPDVRPPRLANSPAPCPTNAESDEFAQLQSDAAGLIGQRKARPWQSPCRVIRLS